MSTNVQWDEVSTWNQRKNHAYKLYRCFQQYLLIQETRENRTGFIVEMPKFLFASGESANHHYPQKAKVK